MNKRVVFHLAMLAAFAITGCGKVQPVKGRVVYTDGSPATELAGHYIMFQSGEHKVGATGVIRADGTFTVGTHTDTDGAMLGKQRVAISPPAREITKPVPKKVILDRYASFETSNLEIDITSGTNTPTITVEKLN